MLWRCEVFLFVLYLQMLFEKCVNVYVSSIHSWLQVFVQKEQPFFFLWLPGCCFLGVQSYCLCFVSLLGVLKIFLAFLLPWLVPQQYLESSAIVLSMHKHNAKELWYHMFLPKAGGLMVVGFILGSCTASWCSVGF